MSEHDLLDDDSSGLVPTAATDSPARASRVCRVLVIEDNRADFVIVEYYLKKADGMDFRLQRAVRLADGLASLATGGVDLVLLDLVLPDSQGWETFRSVRLHAPQVPIIVLTGLDDESVASEAAQEGAQDYLIKGQFDGPTLVRSIHRALARHRGG